MASLVGALSETGDLLFNDQNPLTHAVFSLSFSAIMFHARAPSIWLCLKIL